MFKIINLQRKFKKKKTIFKILLGNELGCNVINSPKKPSANVLAPKSLCL